MKYGNRCREQRLKHIIEDSRAMKAITIKYNLKKLVFLAHGMWGIIIITTIPRVPAFLITLCMPVWMAFRRCSPVWECFLGGLMLLRCRGNNCVCLSLCSFVREESEVIIAHLLDLLLVFGELHIWTHFISSSSRTHNPQKISCFNWNINVVFLSPTPFF